MVAFDGRIRVPFVVNGNKYYPMINKKGRVICVHEFERENEFKKGTIDCDTEKTQDGRIYAIVPVKFQMEMERMRN